jgi:hypothetical protein
MLDDFHERFGQVGIAPNDTRRPLDGDALYEFGTNKKRYVLEDTPDGGWRGIDVTTGEVAFRADSKRRYFDAKGKEIARPRPLKLAPPKDTARQVYAPRTAGTKPHVAAPAGRQKAVANRLYRKAPRK